LTERQEFIGLDDRELVGVPMTFEDWKLELASRAKQWGPCSSESTQSRS